jgi:hypothetical protein
LPAGTAAWSTRPAADAHVAAARRRARLLQRGVDAFRDEVEFGAAFHLQGWPGVVGEHEHGHVVRRLVAPPALPALVGPGAAHRAEHVAPHDPGAHALHALLAMRFSTPVSPSAPPPCIALKARVGKNH